MLSAIARQIPDPKYNEIRVTVTGRSFTTQYYPLPGVSEGISIGYRATRTTTFGTIACGRLGFPAGTVRTAPWLDQRPSHGAR